MGLKSFSDIRVSRGISVLAAVFFMVVGSSSFAAMTFLGVNDNTVSGVDLTDLTKPIIYGGKAGTCTGDGSAVCDSCTGGKTACNQKNIYDNLKVIFSLQTSTTGFVYTDFVFLDNGGATLSYSTNPTLASDGTLTAILTWGEICSALKSGGSGCGESLSGNFSIGLKNSTATETISISVKTRVASGTANDEYVDCDNLTSTGSPGACHFEVARGDAKLYIDQLVFSEGYPETSAASGIPYTDVVVFYATGTDDNTIIASLSNKSDSKTLRASSASKSVTDNRVTGLTNGERYCMMIANKDATGVISFFTPTSSMLPSAVCAIPNHVVGLLDDKSCFIATAAFGSSMAPEVESFRQFRNHFLLTNPVGKSFVRFYYKHSPYYANLIAESEVAKAIVRAALWPLLLFARVSLVFGFWLTLSFAALSVLGIYEIYRRFFLGRRFRGEL